MIKTFIQFINEADEIQLNLEKPELERVKKSDSELEIVINAIDKDKNLRELLKFLKSSTTALTIKCVEDESKEEKEFKWNGHKEDSILFLDVSDLEDEDDENEDEDLENEDTDLKDTKNDLSELDSDENSIE